MPGSDLLDSIRRGRTAIGTSYDVHDGTVAELLCDRGLDFLDIDMQHVAVSIDMLHRMLMALRPVGLPVLVRPLWNDPPLIGQILDAGADGVIVPMVNTAEQARRAVAATRYPPDGTRSWGPFRAAGLHGGEAAYARIAAEGHAVFTQVETAEAVGNLDEILSVAGLSGIVIGPADMAISLGYADDRDNALVRRTIHDVLRRCLEREVPFGFYAGSAQVAAYWIEHGATLVSCSAVSSFISDGVSRLAASLTAARDRQSRPSA